MTDIIATHRLACYATPMRMHLFSVLMIGLAATAHGQRIFKCTDDSGTIVFSESPCSASAQEVYIDDSQSGISGSQYESPSAIYPYAYSGQPSQSESDVKIERADRKDRIAAQRERRRIEQIEAEAQREFNRVLRETNNSKAATRAANVVLSKVDDPRRGQQAQLEYERVVRNTNNSKAAERAANVVLGKRSPVDKENQFAADSKPPHESRPPAHPIFNTKGEMYVPTSPEGEQYIAPNALTCQRSGPNLICPDGIKNAKGVVIEPPNG